MRGWEEDEDSGKGTEKVRRSKVERREAKESRRTHKRYL